MAKKRNVVNTLSVVSEKERIALVKKGIDYWAEERISISKSAARVGLPHSTFIKWRDEYKEAREYFELKRDMRQKVYRDHLSTSAMDSLLKRVEGVEYEVAEVEGVYITDEEGRNIFKPKKAKKKKVFVQPSDTAIIFALTNTDPENFKNRHQVDGDMNVKTVDWSKVPLEERKKLLKYFEEHNQ